MDWVGVMPAVTTPFREDGEVDHDFLARHVRWMTGHRCTGIVALGSLGEGQTLTHTEKRDVLRTCVAAAEGRVPVVAGVSALSTSEAVELARDAERLGCRGLMVLPVYVYRGDDRETRAHFDAVIQATGLSCMLYNNPIAYGTDVSPEQVRDLCVHSNLHAIKESSGDVRRITAVRALVGDRLRIFVGVDDLIVEGVAAGAVGWIAGLVNAYPRESVELFEAAVRGDHARARAVYEWFLPLLRLDVVPKFVQLIKYAQELVEMGSARVRAPRLALTPEEQVYVRSLVEAARATRV